MAPMLDVSYEDYRQFMRMLTRRAQLWTEMTVDNTLLYTQKEGRPLGEFLDYRSNEHPIVCQLGGSDPTSLAEAAQIVERWGYDEINLNVGCPSDRVCGKGEFGASLMKRPWLVRDCIHAMSRRVQIPVTVKTRLGVDDMDSAEFTSEFVRTVAAGGCQHFIMHARKAWLHGLSPAQNRTVPPLHYDRVALLCREFPDLSFSINGGINTLEQVRGIIDAAPPNLRGVMVGRATTNNPCMLWDVDRYIYGEEANPMQAPTRRSIAEAYCSYLEKTHPPDEKLYERSGTTHLALKPVFGLLCGIGGNRVFRVTLDKKIRDTALRKQGPGGVLRATLESVDGDLGPAVLDEAVAPGGEAEAFSAASLLPARGAAPPQASKRKRSESHGAAKGVAPPPVAAPPPDAATPPPAAAA